MDVAALGEAMLADRSLADDVNRAVDSRVEAAAAMPGRVVVDARTAFARDPSAIKVFVRCPLEERARLASAAARGPWLGDSDLLVYYPDEGLLASCVYYGGEGFSTMLASAVPGDLAAYQPCGDAGVLWGYPNAAACLASEAPSAAAIILASGHVRLPDGTREDVPEIDGTPIVAGVLDEMEHVLASAKREDRC